MYSSDRDRIVRRTEALFKRSLCVCDTDLPCTGCLMKPRPDKHHRGPLMLCLCTRWDVARTRDFITAEEGGQRLTCALRAHTHTHSLVRGSTHACLHIKHTLHTHTHLHCTDLSQIWLPLHKHSSGSLHPSSFGFPHFLPVSEHLSALPGWMFGF